MRLIDADALLDYLDDDPPMNWTDSEAEIQAQADWERFKNMVVNAPTIDPNSKTKQQRGFVDPCKDGKRHDWKKWAVSIDAELNTVTTYRCLKCGETFNIKFEKV